MDQVLTSAAISRLEQEQAVVFMGLKRAASRRVVPHRPTKLALGIGESLRGAPRVVLLRPPH